MKLFKIDKRTRKYRNRKLILARFVLGFLVVCVLYSLLRLSLQPEPLISPLSDIQPLTEEQKEAIIEDYKETNFPEKYFERIEVKKVEAKEPRVYTHYNHSNKKYYQRTMYWLQTNYQEFEDGAELIARESGFNPFAINPTSGACGLFQSCPCSKMDCPLDDTGIECQLEWGKEYIKGRYGDPTKALLFHDEHGWY